MSDDEFPSSLTFSAVSRIDQQRAHMTNVISEMQCPTMFDSAKFEIRETRNLNEPGKYDQDLIYAVVEFEMWMADRCGMQFHRATFPRVVVTLSDCATTRYCPKDPDDLAPAVAAEEEDNDNAIFSKMWSDRSSTLPTLDEHIAKIEAALVDAHTRSMEDDIVWLETEIRSATQAVERWDGASVTRVLRELHYLQEEVRSVDRRWGDHGFHISCLDEEFAELACAMVEQSFWPQMFQEETCQFALAADSAGKYIGWDCAPDCDWRKAELFIRSFDLSDLDEPE